jgi:drug/metabolite transporter (DMT)-like permease
VRKKKQPLRAAWMLIVATVCWSLSFLSMKALVMTQQTLVPNISTMFLSSLSVIVRFGISSIVLLLFCLPTLKRLTRLEIIQGLGLGIIGGIGLLLQMDGVNYTHGSTSAFLTQCYCLFIPIVVALRERKLPSRLILISSVMVLSGIAILSEVFFKIDARHFTVEWHQIHMGRGEWETIVATIFFTGQILWLERPKFSENSPNHFSLVMFVSTALIVLPVTLVSDSTWHDAVQAFSSGPSLFFAGILTGVCTLGGYVLMNFWQPHIEASKAGLIYCAEPVFVSIFALFLPALFSKLAGINYPNEEWTFNLIAGGGLITGANILIMLQTARAAKQVPAQSG